MKLILIIWFLFSALANAAFENNGNDILYYIMVDRFEDGDPNNNIPNFAFSDSLELTSWERLP